MLPPICDAHAHIFPDDLAERASRNIGEFYGEPMHAPASVGALLREEESIGAKHTLVCSSALSPHQVEPIDDFIAAACRAHPFFVGLGAMHPAYEGWERELDRAATLGLRGVKLHPDFQGFALDDPAMLPFYRALSRRGMTVLFHIGDNRGDLSSPTRLARLLERVPDLRVQAAHFGGYRVWDEVEVLPPGNPNLWFDTSSSLTYLPRERVLQLIDRYGYRQFLFGTDFPMWSASEELARFLALGLPERQERAILSGNFERIYFGADNAPE